MANIKSGRISDKLVRWEAEKDPLAPLSQSQINAYLSLSEHIGNSDFMVCVYNITLLKNCVLYCFDI